MRNIYYPIWSLLLYCLLFAEVGAQVVKSNIEFRLRNDNAGEISNLLKTGDDLGETIGLMLAVNLLNHHPRYNFRFKLESTEYSALDLSTLEKRDILFTELNNLDMAIDNNKFADKSCFYSAGLGLNYIQGRHVSSGATGVKYYIHQSFISKLYNDRVWIYRVTNNRDHYIPYISGKLGINRKLFSNHKHSVNSIHQLDGRVASDYRFSGLGAKSYLDYQIKQNRRRLKTIDIEFEGAYMTNFTQYQSAYAQLGFRMGLKQLMLYIQINKPLSKYIQNPLIKYDDMEWLFNYGLIYTFKNSGRSAN